jgi:hypothetical protein
MAIWDWFLRAFEPSVLWAGGAAEDAEAFLAGRLLERSSLVGDPWPIPGWYWLNGVAHGDQARLAEIAAEEPAPEDPNADLSWSVARSMLARDVLVAGQGSLDRLAQVQRELLVPLELHLACEERITAKTLLSRTRSELGPLLR